MSWEGRDPWRDEDGPPSDPDRSDAALERLLLRVTTGQRHRNGKSNQPLPPAADGKLSPAQVLAKLRRLK